MSTPTTLLIVGILLLAAGSLFALVFAIMRAPEGHEDDSGFHVDAQSAATTTPVEGSATPWDRVEGGQLSIKPEAFFRPQ